MTNLTPEQLAEKGLELVPWSSLADVKLDAWYRLKNGSNWFRIIEVDEMFKIVQFNSSSWWSASELHHLFLHKPDHEPFDSPWRECVKPVAVSREKFLAQSTEEHRADIERKQGDTPCTTP